MPAIAKARRRDAKRQRRLKMAVDGRGLMTNVPNWEERKRREDRRRRVRG